MNKPKMYKLDNSAFALKCTCDGKEIEIVCSDLLKLGDYIKKINRRMVFSERRRRIK